MNSAPYKSQRAQEMRQEFDRSFTLPHISTRTLAEQLLAISIGALPFAIRLSEISGLHADKNITRVPGTDKAMIGIAGFRGAIAPIYDLASLMGEERNKAPRWLIVAARAPIGFAFDGFDGQLRVPPDAIKHQTSGHAFVRELVQTENMLRPIIGLQPLVESIKA